jgi:hypothetical protein
LKRLADLKGRGEKRDEHVKEFVNDVMCAGPPDEWTLSSVMIMKMMMMKSFTTDRYNNRSKAEKGFC